MAYPFAYGINFGNCILVGTWQNQNNETMAEKTLSKRSTCVHALADIKHYVPIKVMVVTGNSSDFTIRETVQKRMYITRHLLWNTLEFNQSSALLKLGNTEVTPPTLVAIPLMNKYRVKTIMDSTDLISDIVLFTGVIWQALHKLNTITIEDINQSV